MKRHILGARTIYFEMTLHVNIEFKVDSSPKVVEITYGSFQNELHIGLGLHLKYCI